MQSTMSVIERNSLHFADYGTDETVTSIYASNTENGIMATAHTVAELEITPGSITGSTNGSPPALLDGTFSESVSGEKMERQLKLSARSVPQARNHGLELLQQQQIS